MNRQYIEENQVIERYLAGQLTADEEEAFEAAYLGDPAILEELELAQRMKQGLEVLEEEEALERFQPHGAGGVFSSPKYAIAASILLVLSLVSTGVLYRENQSLRETQDSRTTQLVPLVSVRGSSATVIAAPGAQKWIVLLVDPGFADYDRFRVTVEREQGSAPVWQVTDLEPGYEDLLAVGMPGSLLAPGDYEVRVEGRGNDWPTDRPFDQVTRVPLRVESPQ